MQTQDMTKRQLAEALAGNYNQTTEGVASATEWYLAHMTKPQLLEQVEYIRGERRQDQLTHKYDH
jgi:hypothetical protein